MFKQVSIILKLNSETDPKVELVANIVRNIAWECNLDVDLHPANNETLLVAIGGDGTMLEAMRQSVATGATCIGVNLGRVGFLTDVSWEDGNLHDDLRWIFSGKGTWTENRRLLVADAPTYSGVAGNEVSVSARYSDSMICYRLTIGNMVAGIHRANSIMIATATGSTAYSLSAGGALMMPDLASMQIVPVAPLTLTSRPIVVPSHVSILIEAWGGPISVRLDGQVQQPTSKKVYSKDNPFTLYVNTNTHAAKLLHQDGWNYFDVLTEKLGWIKE